MFHCSFVEIPSLAQTVFGQPQAFLGEGLGYPCDSSAKSPTPAPVAETGGGSISRNGTCMSLSPGAVIVVTMNSDDPDLVALVALENIPGGVNLYMTDNAWTGNSFRTNEGTIMVRGLVLSLI